MFALKRLWDDLARARRRHRLAREVRELPPQLRLDIGIEDHRFDEAVDGLAARAEREATRHSGRPPFTSWRERAAPAMPRARAASCCRH